MQNNFDQVWVSVNNRPLGEVLKMVDNKKCELFYSHYLHDFELSITHGSGNPQVCSVNYTVVNVGMIILISSRCFLLFLVIQCVLWMCA